MLRFLSYFLDTGYFGYFIYASLFADFNTS